MLRRAAAGLTGSGIKGQLLRAGAGGLGVRILSLFATLLSSVVLARVLGDSGYGLYVFALSVTALLALPVQVGLPTLVVRETAGAETKRDWVAMHSIRVWAIRVNFLFGAVVIVSIVGFTLFAGEWLSADTVRVFWVAAALILPLALTSTFGATLRGLRWVMSGLYPNDVLRPLLISALVAASLFFWSDGASPEIALVLNFISTVLVLLLLLVLVRRALPHESRPEHVREFMTRHWMRALFPLALISGMQMVNRTTDLVMIGVFLEPADVGHYKIAVSSASLLAIGLSTIGLVAMPYIRRLFIENDYRRLQLLASICSTVSVLLALPILLVFLFWGGDLLRFVYGEDFIAAWSPMLILSGAQLGNAFFGVLGPLLLMAGHERIAPWLMGISTIVNVALNAVLIPIYGISGAAVATGFSILTWNLLYWWAVKRLIRIDASLLGWLSIFLRRQDQ